jgi:hypothetical protein
MIKFSAQEHRRLWTSSYLRSTQSTARDHAQFIKVSTRIASYRLHPKLVPNLFCQTGLITLAKLPPALTRSALESVPRVDFHLLAFTTTTPFIQSQRSFSTPGQIFPESATEALGYRFLISHDVPISPFLQSESAPRAWIRSTLS